MVHGEIGQVTGFRCIRYGGTNTSSGHLTTRLLGRPVRPALAVSSKQVRFIEALVTTKLFLREDLIGRIAVARECTVSDVLAPMCSNLKRVHADIAADA